VPQTLPLSPAAVREARTDLAGALTQAMTQMRGAQTSLERALRRANGADLPTPGARHTITGAREQLEVQIAGLRSERDEVLDLNARSES
jgi:hypothetical protein